MKAARLREYGQALQLQEVPAPELSGDHDVIVRIGGAGVCRTDLHIIDGMLRGLIEVELPYTLGHENAGWVEAVGDAVRSVRVGDAVIVHPAMTCGVCAGCQRGEDMYVEHVIAAGDDAVQAVRELSGGGVNAVLDFVGEQDTPAQAIAMLAQRGTYYVVGYGSQLNVPLADLLAREISIVTNLVGNHTELEELIALAATQRVRLETQEYRLDQINEAFDALQHGDLRGRAVVVPSMS